MTTDTAFLEALQQTQGICQRGDFARAAELCRQLTARWPGEAEAWHLSGLVRIQRGELPAAERDLSQAATLAPNHPTVCVNLGELCRRLEKPDDAVRWFEHALRVAPRLAIAHFNLANVLRLRGETERAIAHYRQVIEIEPRHVRGHFNLGNTYLQAERLDDALRAYDTALALDPAFVPALTNKGSVLSRLARNAESLACYQQAVRVAPRDGEAHGNLAQAFAAAGRLDEAAREYHVAMQCDPRSPGWPTGLGDLHREADDFDAASQMYALALRLDPDATGPHHGLAIIARERHLFDEAERHYQHLVNTSDDPALALRNWGLSCEVAGRMEQAKSLYDRLKHTPPADPQLELHAETLCPLFFDDNAAIDAYRAHVGRVLDRLENGVDLKLEEVATTSCHVPFTWPYLGRNERELKTRWAHLFRNSFPASEPPRSGSGGLPHVGFVVTTGHESIFLRSMRGILERWPKGRSKVTIVCGGPTGAMRLRDGLARAAVDYLPMPGRFDQAVTALRDARFDLLYHWEVATDAVNYFLPFCRLARVQCTGWGWQVTTGIPQVDCYISSRDLEPANAATHYSERLELLDGLPTCYARPRVPETRPPRETWGIAADQSLYFCAQNLLKVHPDFDPIVAGILRADPRAVVVFTAGRHAYRAELLRRRWEKTIPDVVGRTKILTGLAEPEYLRLLAAADVSLDTLHYGGVNTTYDSLAAGTPVITLPGEFQRGRYTAAVYKRLQIGDAVASSIDEYIGLAVRAATDADWRRDFCERLRERVPILFDDPAPATELANCFEKLLADTT